MGPHSSGAGRQRGEAKGHSEAVGVGSAAARGPIGLGGASAPQMCGVEGGVTAVPRNSQGTFRTSASSATLPQTTHRRSTAAHPGGLRPAAPTHLRFGVGSRRAPGTGSIGSRSRGGGRWARGGGGVLLRGGAAHGAPQWDSLQWVGCGAAVGPGRG